MLVVDGHFLRGLVHSLKKTVFIWNGHSHREHGF